MSAANRREVILLWASPATAALCFRSHMGIPTGPVRTKKCSACGADLVCGPADGEAECWCEALPKILPFTGADCLCPKCAEAEVSRLENKRRSEEAGNA